MANDSDYRAHGPGPAFHPGPFEPTEALHWAFAVLRAEPQRIGVPLVAAAFVLVLTTTVAQGALQGMVGLVTAAAPGSLLATMLSALARLFGAGLSLVVMAYVCTGVYPFVLNVARGRPVAFADLFVHGRSFARVASLLFLLWVAIGVGSMLCVLPGVLVVVMTSMAVPLLIDSDMSAVAAFRGSIELAKPYLASLFVFCLLCFVAVVAGMLLCFAGAVVVTIPAVFLAHAYVYLRLHGETPVSV